MGNEDDGPRPPGVTIPVRMTTASTNNQVAQGAAQSSWDYFSLTRSAMGGGPGR